MPLILATKGNEMIKVIISTIVAVGVCVLSDVEDE